MKAFISELSGELGISNTALIEKDVLLHQILVKLEKNDYFRTNFIFKGGTCLIKSYLGYYRFSEDLDFTWIDQDIYRDMSGKKMRRFHSDQISEAGGILEMITKDIGMDFVCDKGNEHYIQIGGSGKMVTFKLWYHSVILNTNTFLKIQINFVEKILFPVVERRLNSLITDKKTGDLGLFFPEEYKQYVRKIYFNVYDPKEILAEKMRAIATRQGTKARDFVDVFMICEKYGIDLIDIMSDAIEKISFSVGMYDKYQNNLKNKIELIRSGELFEWGQENELLLFDISKKELYHCINEINAHLLKLLEQV